MCRAEFVKVFIFIYIYWSEIVRGLIWVLVDFLEFPLQSNGGSPSLPLSFKGTVMHEINLIFCLCGCSVFSFLCCTSSSVLGNQTSIYTRSEKEG